MSDVSNSHPPVLGLMDLKIRQNPSPEMIEAAARVQELCAAWTPTPVEGDLSVKFDGNPVGAQEAGHIGKSDRPEGIAQ